MARWKLEPWMVVPLDWLNPDYVPKMLGGNREELFIREGADVKMEGWTNPNEYDDGRYTKAVIDLHSAMAELVEAGASEQNLQDEIDNALENAKGET